MESKFSVFDMRTFNAKSGYASLSQSAHKSTIWCGAHLPQNRDVFMTTAGTYGSSVTQFVYDMVNRRTAGVVAGCTVRPVLYAL